ncbi:hypothetical protein XENORESO_017611 [Xenotaenia resolanae]|uniref:Uncharacterized protein n=1 Tax=Xenotaenia resolanae TaxID=208358 RepID=A0ABV0X450_9TELE
MTLFCLLFYCVYSLRTDSSLPKTVSTLLVVKSSPLLAVSLFSLWRSKSDTTECRLKRNCLKTEEVTSFWISRTEGFLEEYYIWTKPLIPILKRVSGVLLHKFPDSHKIQI